MRYIITMVFMLPFTLFAQHFIRLKADTLNTVKQNQILTMSWLETPSTGYTWHCTILDSAYSQLIYKKKETLKQIQEEASTSMEHSFEFECTGAGKVVLLFELYKDWEGSLMAIKQHSIPVLIEEEKKTDIVMRGIPTYPQKMYDWEDADIALFSEFHENSPSIYPNIPHVFVRNHVFTIDLENRIKGAYWIPVIDNESSVQLVKDKLFSRAQVAYSVYALHCFQFMAMQSGNCTIAFKLVLPDGEIIENDAMKWTIQIKD